MGHYADYTGNPRKKYKFINDFGLDSMLNAEGDLDISDTTSGIFDGEMKEEALNILQEQIQDLGISIS